MSYGFLPPKRADYLVFAQRFTSAANQYKALLGIPDNLVSTLETRLTAFSTAYNNSKKVNAGKLDRENRDSRKTELTACIRKIKNGYIDPNPSGEVTLEIRLSFGLPPKDTIKTDEPDPTDEVDFQIKHAGYRQILVLHGAKPKNYNGAVALYKVVPPGGTIPTLEDLRDSRLLTKKREIMAFPDTQIGYTLFITLVWENGKGRRGPAGPIQNILIG